MGSVNSSVAGQARRSNQRSGVPSAPGARGLGRPHAGRTLLVTLGTLTVLAAVLRFATLDAQSLWYDEALTLGLTHGSLHDMMDGIRAHEANPPLYYALARFWSRVFGD